MKEREIDMKETIKEEYKKFESIAEGLDNHLCALLLTDIMAVLTDVHKNDKGEIVKDFKEFDDLVNKVKDLLNSVQSIPNIDIKWSTKENLEQVNRMFEECKYSMRTLKWIENDLLAEEKENA